MEHEDGWRYERSPNRLIPYKNNWQNDITIELTLNQEKWDRRVYSLLDFFSDLGGLYGAIAAFFAGIISIINYFSSYQFIMVDLFVDKERKLEANNV